MKIIEGVLFKLALEEKITLEQARIINYIYEKNLCSIEIISRELDMTREETVKQLIRLFEMRIINHEYDLVYTQNLSEKLADLIRKEEPEKIVLVER